MSWTYCRTPAPLETTIDEYPAPDLDGAAKWIKSNVPAGETIAHLDWGDFVQLYHFDPTHHYLVGLDPMFMYVRNPKRMRLLEDLRQGRRPFDAAEIADTFKSRWLVTRNRYRPLVEDSGLKPSYLDAGAAVYNLKE